MDARQLDALAWEAIRESATMTGAARRLSLKADEIAARTVKIAPQSLIDMCWGKSCGDALFFGIENGVPTMVNIKFVQIGNNRASLNAAERISSLSDLGSCSAARDARSGAYVLRKNGIALNYSGA
jgi:hypothetical protein